MKRTLDKPCKECPFRRKSLPGYLGNSNPKEFIETTMADTPMPCHLTVDYEDEDGAEKAEEEAEYCYGALVFFSNTCKLSRDPERPKAPADHDEVFSHKMQFLEHHEG